MNKQITLSILTSGLLFLAGCGSDSTASIPQENQVVQQSSGQSFSPLETRGNHSPTTESSSYCINNDDNLTANLDADDNDGTIVEYAFNSSDINYTKGSIELNATSGEFKYVPANNFVGEYKLRFTAKDNDGATATNTVTILVKDAETVTSSVPTAPTGLTVVTQNKTCVKLKWCDKSSNEDGFKIYKGSVLVKTVPANCACTTISGLSAGERYTFQVVSYKGEDESTASEVTVTMDDSDVNSVPVAYSKTYCTYVDTNLTGQLCAYDADGDALTYAIDANSSNGTIDLNATTGRFTYAPATGVTGIDTFTFTASDETNTSEVKTITINVRDRDGVKPEAPTDLNVTVVGTDFNLTWVDNSDNENEFRIYRNGNHIETVGADETNATIAIDDDLNISKKYLFEVRAINSYGCSDAAATECKVWSQ